MKKFIYTMASLLGTKYSLEKQIKQRLFEEEHKLFICLSEINGLDIKKSETKEQMYKEGTKNIRELLSITQYYSSLEKKKSKKVSESIELETSAESIRQELRDITEDIKILEKFKEKQYEAYLSELKREQDKEIDDLLTYKITATR